MSMDALNETVTAPEPANTAFELYQDVPPPKMVAMLLERNYVPMSENYEVIGYNREPKSVKSAAGVMVVVDKGGFIQEADEDTGKIKGMPSVLAGTGFANKLNAGTVVKLPVDEAKRVLNLKIGSRTLDD